MACIRRREGRWVVDFRNRAGLRRTKRFRRHKDAEQFLATVIRESKKKPLDHENVTMGAYAEQWLSDLWLRPFTIRAYTVAVKNHILPYWSEYSLQHISRGEILRWLKKEARRYKPATVRQTQNVFRSILQAAVDDEILEYNPADGAARKLKLAERERVGRGYRKAMTIEELQRFLSAAEGSRHYYPFMTMARTGMRTGEIRGLEPGDLLLKKNVIHVERSFSFSAKAAGPTKGKKVRDVQIPDELSEKLAVYLEERNRTLLKLGLGRSRWLFVTERGNALSEKGFYGEFAALLKKAGLSAHHTPKSFRHTYASILIQMGASAEFVQQQLGHASISQTVDTYGSWLQIDGRAVTKRYFLETEPKKRERQVLDFPGV